MASKYTEKLGPNMARTLLGGAYDETREYELVMTEEVTRVMSTNPNTGELESVDIMPDIPNEELLADAFTTTVQGKRRPLLFNIVTYGVMFLSLAVIVGVILWRSGVIQ